MAIIYKVTNLINGKIYIGETIRPLNIRWNEHKSASFNKKDHGYNFHLHCAIRKYGIENFDIEILEKCEDENRFVRETYYILKYQSYDRLYGYNYIIEGKGASPYSSKDFLDLWNQGLLIKEIAEKMNCHKSTVSKRLLNNGISKKEIQERHGIYIRERDGKPVLQYTLEGKFIKEFPSAGSCEKEGFQQSAVSSVCNQKQKSAYNFLWKYKDDSRSITEWVENYKNKKTAGKPKKKIGQYSLEDNSLINVYESGADAARAIGLNDKSCICRAARKKGKSHGYYWRYLLDE